MQPTITPISYTYKKTQSDVRVLNGGDIPLPQNLVKDQQIIYLGPGSIGGNHTHPRTEWFIAFGDLVFVWLDHRGEKHEDHMNPNGELFLFTVPPYLPHAVVNQSKDRFGILYELSDAKMTDVKYMQVADLLH